MKIQNIFCLLVVFIVLSATSALAENTQYFNKGDLELGFQGSYTNLNLDVNNTNTDFDFFYMGLDASYFLTNNLSLGVGAVWFYLPEGERLKAKSYALGLEGNARYHFQVNQHFVPYVGAHAGYYYTKAEHVGLSDSDKINTYGLQAGLKVPINENVFFDTQLKWTDYDLPWEGVDLSATQVLLGLKIKF